MTGGPDARFPLPCPTRRYDLLPYVPFTSMQGDMVHRFYTEQYQINDPDGRYRLNPKNAGGHVLSKFAAWSDNPGLVLTHYDAQNLGEGLLGKQFTICDNNFHSAFGGSFLNHQFLVAARAPVWPAAPTTPDASAPPATGTNVTTFDANGYPAVLTNGTVSDGFLTADGDLPPFNMSNANQRLNPGDYWAVNTLRPLRGPAGGFSTAATAAAAPTSNTPVTGRLPLQYHDTIGDRLTAAGINWAWYSGGWNNAKAGKADFLFQFHHQPFAFFAKYALATTPVPQTATAAAIPGTDSPGSALHLKDEDADFYPGADRPGHQDQPAARHLRQAHRREQPAPRLRGGAGRRGLDRAGGRQDPGQHGVQAQRYLHHLRRTRRHVGPRRPAAGGRLGSRPAGAAGSGVALREAGLHRPHASTRPIRSCRSSNISTICRRSTSMTPTPSRSVAPFVGQPDLIVRAQAGEAFSYTLPAYGIPSRPGSSATWTA